MVITTKHQIFRDAFSLFVKNHIPDGVLENYLNDENGEGASELQWWIVNNMNDNINSWATGIGILDAVELLYESALENGNIKNIEGVHYLNKHL